LVVVAAAAVVVVAAAAAVVVAVVVAEEEELRLHRHGEGVALPRFEAIRVPVAVYPAALRQRNRHA
jgi:hypothetical protein